MVITAWSIESGQCIHKFEGYSCGVFALSSDRNVMIGGQYMDDSLKVWDLNESTQIQRYVQADFDDQTSCLVYINCDASFIVNCFESQTVVYSFPELAVIRHIHSVIQGCFHPSKPHLFAMYICEEKSLRIVDLVKNVYIRTFVISTRINIYSLCFTPDGSRNENKTKNNHYRSHFDRCFNRCIL